MIDNRELEEIMSILENLDDQVLGVKLLREFNDKTRVFSLLLNDKNPVLSHDEWKEKCDFAKKEVDEIVKKIKSL